MSILPALLAISYFLFPLSALTATHVTATYDLGANPRVMATVNGTPQYGLVFAQRNKLVTYGDVEYGPSVVKAYLNSSGQLNDGAGNLWLDLIPNLGATPGDSYYVLTLNIQGRVHAEIWVVPDVASVSGEVCRQAQPPSSTSPALFYQFLQQDGDDLPQRQKLNFSGAGVNCVDNAGQLRTDCAVSGGGGSVSKASATTSGTVKTDTTESDPVVYLKSSADSLLAAKAPLAHSHAESDVTNLVTDLAAKVASTRAVNTTAPLSGGGALSSDLTLSLPAASGSQSGYLASGDWTTFNNKVSTSRSISTTAPLQGGGNLSADRTLSIDLFGTSPGTKVVSTSLAGDPATDNCVKWLAGGKLGDAGAACGSGGGSHNLLSTTHSDTSAASVVLGDLIAGNSTPAWQRVAGNTTTTKKFLTQTGTGSVSALPAWGTIADADIPSTIVRTSRQISTTSPLGGGGTLASDLTLTCPTCEVTGNKNAASGYAGLTASTKLNVAQGQEVWGLSDLSNVSGTSGSGSTAILSTLTSLAASDLLKWSGSNWVNTSSIPESQVTNLTTDLAGKVPTSRNLNTSSPLGGGGALNSDLTLTCATCEVTGNKNAASGYAGLTSGTKLTASQGQEVWSVSDLTDYSTTSGSGSTALKATITSPSSNDVLTWNGSNWINQAPSGGSSHNFLSSTHTDTDAGSAVLGDIISANSTPHWQPVAGNTTSTKKFLTQTGTGSASALPAWGTIADADIPNTIARTASPTLTGTVTLNGVVSESTTDSGTADLIGVNTWAESQNTSGTRATVLGVSGGAAQNGAGGTATAVIGVGGYAEADAGTVGNLVSLIAYANGNYATAINNYGLFVQPQTAGTNNYAIYTQGTAPSVFGGFVDAVGGFKVNGAATNHSVLLGNGAIYQGSSALPDCQDSGGNHLNYTRSTQAFSCGTTGGGASHNLLSSTHSDTVAASVVLGDLVAGNSTPAWQRVAGNTTTTKKYLNQTGNGSVSALPIWAAIADGDLPSTIVRTSRSISTTAPLLGGGDLSADRTFSIDLFGTVPGSKVASTSLAGDPTTDNCVKWIAGGKLGDAGAACGAGGGGDNISVNGTAATDADFDDATPAAPANAINVKWQKDTSTPNNLSAYLPYAAPLTVSSGNLTADSSVVRTSQANTYTAGQKQTIPTADVSGTLRGKLTSDLQGDSSSDFTIVQIPDPECYSQDGMCTGSLVAMMTSFINWIVSNKTTENIRAVVFTGDLTHTGVAAEFTQQGSQIATLDSNSIRVAVTPGNHDYTATNTRDLTGTGKWDVTFPTTRWSGNSWWVDSYPTGHTESVGIKFDVDGKKYGILTMGMCPGSNIQTWAQGILNGETDRRWLIATHDWTLATNGERETSSSDPDSCSTYFSTGNWAYPNAAWASFAAGNDGQILGIVSGHHPDGAYAANRVDVGTYGYVVPQATADYQNDTNGGNGYIRLLKFRPSLGIVEVKTYSPYASAYKTDTWNQFTMPLASVASLASVGSTSDMAVKGALRIGATDLAIGDRFRFLGRNVSTSYCPATAFCFDYSPSSGNFYFDSPGVLVFNQYKAYATRFGDGAGSYKLVIASSGQIQSTVATGTAPMTVSSTTLVTNFNADQVDGADVVTAGSAGTAAFNAGTATTLARSDHTHREIHGFTWYFPGTPATGVQNMILPLPEGITNIALTDMRVTVGTAGSTSSTFNIQRCYVSSAACTATGNTWVDIYSSVLTLASSNYSASKGSAPDQNNTSLVAGDRFKASLVTIGTAVADVTVTLVGKWETTN